MEKCGISKLDLKRRNRMQILRVIKEFGPISRVDVASELHITRAAVTIITNEMIEEGVLVEIGEAPVNTEKLQKGRRKILISINDNYKFALGAYISDVEVSIGLSTLSGAVLDKASMIIDDKTMTKDIINFIINKSNEMMDNSCLKKDKILGLGIGIVPSMWGRLKIFYKDGVLDFSNFIDKVSSGVDVEIQCGNAIGILALASNDFENYNGYQNNQVFISYGNQINMAVLNKNVLSSDYMSYTYMIERAIVNPNGRQMEGYPDGSVKAELSKIAFMNAIAEVYSKDKTPVLYEQSNGDKNNITIDALSNAVIRGEEPVINIVNRFIANFAILLNNLACMHFTQRIILHNVELSERQLDYLKRGIAKHVGEDIAERLVLSGIDKKNLFSAGCALIIQESFYFKGGMQ
ncbi:MAG: MarR family winged helix-turn-helix transcriptional regulator [Ruminococcus sp.]|nr:MarR family winged helix-turn-helix transcriptional regulator [Oscillospiraceae bacterium]MDY4414758.1 MarR family winged helix-turn-helix transcriptional regulator [Ruminococcus sp.]